MEIQMMNWSYCYINVIISIRRFFYFFLDSSGKAKIRLLLFPDSSGKATTRLLLLNQGT